MKKQTLRIRPALLSIIVCALLVGGITLVVHAQNGPQDIARSIVAACKGPGDHSACYETEVPPLYPKLSVPQIFNIVQAIRQDDVSYQFCHVLGHKIGERVVALDPNNWVNAIPLNPPNSLCSNGFIHGVFEGRFGSDVLTDATIQASMPQFIEACEPRQGWQPSDLDRAVCYHGMGHLFDFITNANLPKALSLCNSVAPSAYERVCVQGVFMQIYQPLEPDDYALIAQMSVKPATSTVRAFCAGFSGNPMYQGSCLEESWPFFQSGILNGTGIVAFCSGQPNVTETDFCYEGATTIIGRTSLGYPQKVVSACLQIPANRQQDCFEVSAQAILEEDLTQAQGAIALCQQAQGEMAAGCLGTLIQRGGFLFGANTSAFENFCRALPANYTQQCEADIRTQISAT